MLKHWWIKNKNEPLYATILAVMKEAHYHLLMWAFIHYFIAIKPDFHMQESNMYNSIICYNNNMFTSIQGTCPLNIFFTWKKACAESRLWKKLCEIFIWSEILGGYTIAGICPDLKHDHFVIREWNRSFPAPAGCLYWRKNQTPHSLISKALITSWYWPLQ